MILLILRTYDTIEVYLVPVTYQYQIRTRMICTRYLVAVSALKQGYNDSMQWTIHTHSPGKYGSKHDQPRKGRGAGLGLHDQPPSAGAPRTTSEEMARAFVDPSKGSTMDQNYRMIKNGKWSGGGMPRASKTYAFCLVLVSYVHHYNNSNTWY